MRLARAIARDLNDDRIFLLGLTMHALSKSLMRVAGLFLMTAFLASAGGQEFQVHALQEAAPGEVPDALKSGLSPRGFRILDGEGKPLLDLWLRSEIPSRSKPGAPQNGALFPFFEEGEWLGIARYHREGGDYRDQGIPPGVYALRYLVHPVNGDHQGVSPFRDYGLLTPIEQDAKPAVMKREQLEKASAEVAGSNHPTVLMLAAAPADTKAPSMIRDTDKDTWGVALPVRLHVSGEAAPLDFTMVLIVEGAAPL
jgi:hypothetical protein